MKRRNRRNMTMGNFTSNQSPMRLGDAQKRDPRTQFAALPFRRKKDGLQILLITSRVTGRWILPKGWPIDAMTPAASAAQEAWEEAGIRGLVSEACIGFYSYSKTLPGGVPLPCITAVFPLEVRKLEDDYPEAGRRKRKWFTPAKAASTISEPDLKKILRNFDPERVM